MAHFQAIICSFLVQLPFHTFSKQRIIGLGLIGLAWLVAWSRIYLGVHFPLDMLGAFLLPWQSIY